MDSKSTGPVTESELIKSATDKGGERVTLDQIEAAIIGEHYFTGLEGVVGEHSMRESFADHIPRDLSLLTICVLRLWNGFSVLGQSACADPKNFDKALGRRLARAHAVNQIWPLMGYELKSRLARDQRMLGAAQVEPQEDFQTYIGTKVVNARPMTRLNYNILRGWKLPENENGFDDGYLVEYTDRIERPPHVEGFDGYISWSPKEVFERAYRVARLGAV